MALRILENGHGPLPAMAFDLQVRPVARASQSLSLTKRQAVVLARPEKPMPEIVMHGFHRLLFVLQEMVAGPRP